MTVIVTNNSGTIYEIDLENSTTVIRADYPTTFFDIALVPDGTIYATTSRSLVELDIAAGTQTEIATLSATASGLAGDEDGNLFIGYVNSSEVDVFNPSTGETVRTYDLASLRPGIGVDDPVNTQGDLHVQDGTLYVATTDATLLSIDLGVPDRPEPIAEVDHGISNLFGLHVENGDVFGLSGNRVIEIDPETGETTEVATIDISGIANGSASDPNGDVDGTSDTFTITFDEGPEGWGLLGEDTEFHQFNWNDAGWIEATDLGEGDTWYFSSNNSLEGDFGRFAGGNLTFDIRQSGVGETFEDPDVVLQGAGLELEFFLSPDDYPGSDFTTLDVPLSADSRWTIADTGEIATQEQIDSALSALTELRIRGEFRNGEDQGSLDFVQFSVADEDDDTDGGGAVSDIIVSLTPIGGVIAGVSAPAQVVVEPASSETITPQIIVTQAEGALVGSSGGDILSGSTISIPSSNAGGTDALTADITLRPTVAPGESPTVTHTAIHNDTPIDWDAWRVEFDDLRDDIEALGERGEALQNSYDDLRQGFSDLADELDQTIETTGQLAEVLENRPDDIQSIADFYGLQDLASKPSQVISPDTSDEPEIWIDEITGAQFALNDPESVVDTVTGSDTFAAISGFVTDFSNSLVDLGITDAETLNQFFESSSEALNELNDSAEQFLEDNQACIEFFLGVGAGVGGAIIAGTASAGLLTTLGIGLVAGTISNIPKEIAIETLFGDNATTAFDKPLEGLQIAIDAASTSGTNVILNGLSTAISTIGSTFPGVIGATADVLRDVGKAASCFDEATGEFGLTRGDPHLTSFDNLGYSFQAVGEFTLVGSEDGDFLVQVRQEPFGSSQFASENTAVAMAIGEDVVGIYAGQDDLLIVNGEGVNLEDGESILIGEGSIFREGNDFTIMNQNGEGIEVHLRGEHLDVQPFASIDRSSELEGLLGNYDGLPGNDIALPNGTILNDSLTQQQLYTEYADSWRVTDETSLFEYGEDENTATFTDTSFPTGILTIDDFPDADVAAAQAAAEEVGLEPGTFAFDSAVFDFLVTGDPSFLESGLIAAGEEFEVEQVLADSFAETDNLDLLGESQTLTGTDGDDVINGHEGDDTISGLAGDDTLSGGGGRDIVDGGTGRDVVHGNHGKDTLLGGEGDDIIRDSTGWSNIDGGAGNDQISAGNGRDTIVGGDGDDTLTGGKKADTFQSDANDGQDVITDFELNNDILVFDGMPFGNEDGQIDPVTFLNENGTIDGRDLVVTLNSNHSVRIKDIVDSDDPNVSPADFTSVIATRDAVQAAETGGLIEGTELADDINGAAGDDILLGNEADDHLKGGDGNDSILGGDGLDDISGGRGDDFAEGGDGNDYIVGNAGNDTLLGGNGNDVLKGGSGANLLGGGDGNDKIIGGADTDTIIGGEGNDKLTGGESSDTFVAGENSGRDEITDFEIGSDVLDLSDFAFLNAEDQDAARADAKALLSENGIIQDGTDLFLDLGDGRSIKLLEIVDEDTIGEDAEDYADIFF